MTEVVAKFADDLRAAADFLGNGAIEVNMYESEILDAVERESVFLQRVDVRRASGHPHRYFEETAIGTGAFTDPRNIVPTASGPTRIENAAYIKALVAQTNLSLFDVEVTKQQGQFSALEAKDIQDIASAITRSEAAGVWAGTDTSLSSPTTNQYVGILTQITQTSTIAVGAEIDHRRPCKSAVAGMAARTDYSIRPTAIYVNPALGDYIDREAKAMRFVFNEVEVTAGVKVNAIQTQVGLLPIVGEKWIPTSTGAAFGFSAPASGNKNYYAVIVTERDIEMPYISGDGNPRARIFQLGLLSGLQGQYVGVKFNCVIAKGPSYLHQIVAVVRP